jgi:deoxycytidylate deaminase
MLSREEVIVNKQQDVPLNNPRSNIIGFTGSLGSGCTKIAEYLEREKDYNRFTLSDVIWREARKRCIKQPTTEQLQDIGNELRQKHGNNYLVKEIITEINTKDVNEKIIIDSIRNTAEVYELRKNINFYLIAVTAQQELRKKRLSSRYKSRTDQFYEDDERDSEETGTYGQQVRSCVYLSDILIENNDDFYRDSIKEKEFYTNKVNKYINIIENPGSVYPELPETLMTLAYAQSIRSSCLKRKVGAVITTEDDIIVASGYNEVPFNTNRCMYEYGMCYRDKSMLEYTQKFSFCPKCRKRIKIDFKCPKCGKKINKFELKCTEADCGVDLDIPVICSRDSCGFNVREEFKMKELGKCRSLHAEEAAIISVPRVGGGISLKRGKIYTTTFPCNLCANKIVSTGIKNLVYVEPYPDSNSREILEEHEVDIKQFEGVKSRAYFKLFGSL